MKEGERRDGARQILEGRWSSPRISKTRDNMEKFGIHLGAKVLALLPLYAMDFLNLWKEATFALKDSGRMQEEGAAQGIPGISLRENTGELWPTAGGGQGQRLAGENLS